MASGQGKKWDHLIINTHLATMQENGKAYGAISDAALAIADSKIVWIGPMRSLPAAPTDCAVEVFSANGQWLTPGLIDCHTHIVFAGNRACEFEQRLLGKSYEEIARAGGGILSTVQATRASTESELIEQASSRLRHLFCEGVTTVEVKSGYGLQTASELRILRAARRLRERQAVAVHATFLGAHAIAPEFIGNADGYIDLVCNEMLPAVAEEKLAHAVDAYCEQIAFTPAHVRRVFECAIDLGLRVKLHADQLSDGGGAQLAAEYRALSADHLEYTSLAGVQALAEAGTTAVLLPGAYYALGQSQRPPVQALREHGVPMAIATDCNPGTSPLSSPTTAANLACLLFGLTPEESLRGLTLNAARALAVDDTLGSLELGKQADLALWDIGGPEELAYWIGGRRCRRAYRAGEVLF